MTKYYSLITKLTLLPYQRTVQSSHIWFQNCADIWKCCTLQQAMQDLDLASRFNYKLDRFVTQVKGSSTRSSRCSCGYVGLVHPDLGVSFPEISLCALQDWFGSHSCDPHCPGLAQEDVVHRPSKTSGRDPAATARLSGYSVPRPSCFTITDYVIDG